MYQILILKKYINNTIKNNENNENNKNIEI